MFTVVEIERGSTELSVLIAPILRVASETLVNHDFASIEIEMTVEQADSKLTMHVVGLENVPKINKNSVRDGSLIFNLWKVVVKRGRE